MKYIIVLGDGMADEPLSVLGGKTPLAYADTPVMDQLCQTSEAGMVCTIPEGMKPGSDTANLSVLGYDPEKYYSGRSPLEALSIGVPMKDTDIAIRCNFVTLTQKNVPFEEQEILDHSADEISTEECGILLEAVRKELEGGGYTFYRGVSYRHCLIWENGKVLELTPPHDVLTQAIGQYLPEDQTLRMMMEKSYVILKDHPLNIKRQQEGKNPANCCWFWGAGTKPSLPSFEEKTGKKGMMVSAVDLLKGIAVGSGMGVVNVEGANGGLHTNYEGKVKAALQALLEDGYDLVYLHIEAPDEMGHQGSAEKKVKAIEYLDERVLKPLTEKLEESGTDYRLLLLPDHPTPIRVRTHTAAPVPYLLYDSRRAADSVARAASYNEEEAARTGRYVSVGHQLIDYFAEE